jgi:putative phosphoribosyl transferase
MNTRNPDCFIDRTHAGQLLAEELLEYAGRADVIVLGLPRGGVPVASEIAKCLHAPLDVLVVRKLGVPGWEELAMGAIASGGIRVLNESVLRNAGIPDEAIEEAVARELEELHRREMRFRGHTGAPEVAAKVVILVDDGMATGSTARAAAEALRQQNPQKIILAVPVASTDAAELLGPIVDEFKALLLPENFRAVGQWYDDFSQTTDAEVASLLAATRQDQSAA